MPLRRASPSLSPRVWTVLTRHQGLSAADAGEVDTGEVDAGEVAAGEVDAGEVDAGEVDAGEVDDPGPDVGAPAERRAAKPPEVPAAGCEGRHRHPGPPPSRLFTVPTVLRRSRWSVSAGALLGVLGVLVTVTAVLGVRVLWASSRAGPEPGSTALSVKLTPRASPTVGPGEVPATAGSGVIVDIVGQVTHPGVLHLPAGSRVIDALTAAGGALPGAEVAAVNLARVLVDGEQVRIPAPGEQAPPASVVAGTGGGTTGGSNALVNLNTADLAALDTLPGVGPVLAQRILDWRVAHGRFTSIDELAEVSGIGQRMLEQLRPKVTV